MNTISEINLDTKVDDELKERIAKAFIWHIVCMAVAKILIAVGVNLLKKKVEAWGKEP